MPFVFVTTAAIVGCVGLSCQRGGGAPPDFVLITLDTTRVDHLGAYGQQGRDHPQPRRARERRGTLRARVVDFVVDTAGPRVDPDWEVPDPPRRGAGVGLDEMIPDVDSRLRVDRLADDEVLLAERLADAGYLTGAFVAGPWLTPAFGLLQGYQIRDAKRMGLAGRTAAEITDRAIAWLRAAPRDRPLHLFVNYFDPHFSYAPPPRG